MEEKRKEASIRITLTSNYVSKSVIQQVVGTSHSIAGKIFDHCKDLELKKAPIINGKSLDVRPFKVPTKLFLKAVDQDYNFLLKQYSQRGSKKEDVE